MRLLLDTHIFLGLISGSEGHLEPKTKRQLEQGDAELFVSVACLWEIAIKTRIGKLELAPDLLTLPDIVRDLGAVLLLINERHVLAFVEPEPKTRDPFDRLLLAQCEVEGLRLVTADRALACHRLAALAE